MLDKLKKQDLPENNWMPSLDLFQGFVIVSGIFM